MQVVTYKLTGAGDIEVLEYVNRFLWYPSRFSEVAIFRGEDVESMIVGSVGPSVDSFY